MWNLTTPTLRHEVAYSNLPISRSGLSSFTKVLKSTIRVQRRVIHHLLQWGNPPRFVGFWEWAAVRELYGQFLSCRKPYLEGRATYVSGEA